MTSSLSAILDKAFSGAQFKSNKTKPNIERSDQMSRIGRSSSVTPEQREQIVLYITTQRGDRTKKQCLQDAFEKFGAKLSAESSSTLHRWYNIYGKDPALNPALRKPSPGSPAAVLQEAAAEPAKGAKLTSGQLLAKYPEILKEMAGMGTAKAFEVHPEWKTLIMPQIAAAQILYTAINTARKQLGVYKKGAKRKTMINYTPAHFDIMQQILNTQSFRNASGKKVVWEMVFSSRPDWAPLFNWPAAKAAIVAYSNRVRSGKTSRPEDSNGSSVVVHQLQQEEHPEPINLHAVNGTSIAVAGREYTLLELEKIITEYREFLHAPKACPDCGYPLLMHVKAYNIALKHRRVEREF